MCIAAGTGCQATFGNFIWSQSLVHRTAFHIDPSTQVSLSLEAKHSLPSLQALVSHQLDFHTHNEIMRTSMLDKEISPLNFIGVFELQKKIAYNPTLKSITPP